MRRRQACRPLVPNNTHTVSHTFSNTFSAGLLTLSLVAQVVHAAARTDTAADGDEQRHDKANNTKDHGQW